MADSPELRDLLHRVTTAPGVSGVVLTGSVARGTETAHSDVDVYVIADARDNWRGVHSERIDVAVLTVADLSVPVDPTQWCNRYSWVDARILFERDPGTLAPLIGRWASLTAAEIDRCLHTYLDGYINFVYRSLKAHREGRAWEQRLDAVESINWMLWVVFAVFGRVRPYNKYLRHELSRRPLDEPGWRELGLIDCLTRIMDRGDPDAQRQIYRLVEASARQLGHGRTVDGWGHELTLIRGE